MSWLGQELAAALKHLIKEKYSLLKCSLLQPWRYKSLLAGGCQLSMHLLWGGRLPQAEGSGGTDSLPFFIRRWRPASLPETEAGAAQG